MSQPIIKLQHITAAYPEKTALKNVNLTVYDDDYLGIIGPNGGGKTTLIKIMLGLMKPKEGQISFYKNGQKTDHICMGYLPQYTNIDKNFPINVEDVVISGLKKRLFGKYTTQQLQQVKQTIEQMELNALRHQPIGTLSGGQLQRVLLARAIVQQPDVLILDEPNTYIDKRFQEQMYEMLADINHRCAIVMVSHDIAEILNNVKHIACVNEGLHYHETTDLPQEKLEEHFLKI